VLATVLAAVTLAGCPVFPADNAWNRRVDRLPVAPNSAALIESIGLDDHVHADFGSGRWDGGPIGIPITVVDGNQARVPVRFGYEDESDPGPYPIPPNARIEGGRRADGDRHVVVVDKTACRLYELFRPKGWTSADAAGLPILPGLARYEEVASGAIRHALRFTAPATRRAYVWPARHFASSDPSSSLPPMGLRVRLKRSVPIGHLPPQARAVARALKRYGMVLADNGSPWYVSGAPHPGWDDDQLHALHRLRGSDFEVVRVRPRRRG
jgi:hypothetical protein